MANSSHRLMYRFWLDIEKPEEEVIADKIEALKNKRNFSSVIRDGIRLVCDLRDGKLDVLFELFPWVRAEFLQYMREVAMEVPTGQVDKPVLSNQHLEAERAWIEAEQERLEQERAWQERQLEAERQALEAERQQIEAKQTASQRAIQEQLDRIEQWMLSQGHQPIERPIEPQSHHPNGGKPVQAGGPKQLTVPQFAPPSVNYADDEDDEDLLKTKKDENAGMRTTMNFLSSVKGLNKDTEQPPKTNTSYNQSREAGQQCTV